MDREVLKRSVVIWCGSDAAASPASLIAAQRSECDILHATSCRALGVSQAWLYQGRRGDALPWNMPSWAS